jgi:uncharacterized C2H2 Zn-finger protein
MQNNEPKIPQCFTCHEVFEDFKALALHVFTNKSTHRKSIKWAAKVLTNVERLNQKQDLSGRIPLTEEQHEAKRNCVRELSGEIKTAMCKCPHCQKLFPNKVEIEHYENPTAWRENKHLMMLCSMCDNQRRF